MRQLSTATLAAAVALVFASAAQAATTTTTSSTGSTSALGNLTGTDTSQLGAFNQDAPAGSVATVLGSFFTNPPDSTNGGAVTATNTTNPLYAANDIVGGASVLDTPVVTNGAQANAASVDRAIREVAKERRRIGRNGQLLNTIAPRTNGVDRSREMPDDPLPPSLTGTNSTLVR